LTHGHSRSRLDGRDILLETEATQPVGLLDEQDNGLSAFGDALKDPATGFLPGVHTERDQLANGNGTLHD
jgi:hypothetical protein